MKKNPAQRDKKRNPTAQITEKDALWELDSFTSTNPKFLAAVCYFEPPLKGKFHVKTV